MNKNTMSNSIGSFMGLGLSLILPSLNQVQKYLGTMGIFLYIPVAFFALSIIYRYYFKRFLCKATEKHALWLTVITFLGLITIFLLVFPVVDSGFIGPGSDRNEDANIATLELLQGRYPYYTRTYLGNYVSHLPGSLLLSAPFVLLGDSAYQNFFWFFLFIITAVLFLNDRRSAIFLFWIIILLSPVVMQEFVTGGDLIANSIYILFFIFFMINSISKTGVGKCRKALSAILLGMGLSSRFNYVLLLPLVFSALVQNAGWKPAVKYVFITGLTFLALTVPFYLYDPKGFSPLYIQFSKIGRLDSISSFAPIFVLLAGGIIGLIFAFQRMSANCVVLFRNCAFLQAFLVICAIILDTIRAGRLNLDSSGYGFSFLFFGALSFWHGLIQKDL